MKVLVVLALCLTVAACNDGGAPAGGSRNKIANRRDSVSYFYGTTIGNAMRHDSVDMNAEMIFAGLRDALGGDTVVLTDSGYRRVIEAFSNEMRTKSEARQMQQAMDQQRKDSIAGLQNKSEGDAYLASNKAKPDVVTLPSGLQYKVVKEGTGPVPKPTDRVLVLYRGSLINGTTFDSSGVTPVTFGVTEVVPGWTEALQKMKVGSKWQLTVPPALGYGERSPGGMIGPNAVLLFDMELVGIAPPEPAGQSQQPMQLTPEQMQQMQQQMQQQGGAPGGAGHP